MIPLIARDTTLAIDLALRRPPSLRRAARRSAADAAAICRSASGHARLILATASGVEGLGVPSLHIPTYSDLEVAFRKSRTLHEEVTARIRELEFATHEDRPQYEVDILCRLRIADIDEI